MVEDRIERDISVSSPQERVWQVLTQAEHLGTWFGDSAEVDLRPGGAIVFRWDTYGTRYALIEKVDEPHYFSYRWNPGLFDEKPTPDNSTLVEFTLVPQGERTLVRVVETGFSRLGRNDGDRSEQFKKNTDGWAIQLRSLQEYVEQAPVPPIVR